MRTAIQSVNVWLIGPGQPADVVPVGTQVAWARLGPTNRLISSGKGLTQPGWSAPAGCTLVVAASVAGRRDPDHVVRNNGTTPEIAQLAAIAEIADLVRQERKVGLQLWRPAPDGCSHPRLLAATSTSCPAPATGR
jgi:hypothetical protein